MKCRRALLVLVILILATVRIEEDSWGVWIDWEPGAQVIYIPNLTVPGIWPYAGGGLVGQH